MVDQLSRCTYDSVIMTMMLAMIGDKYDDDDYDNDDDDDDNDVDDDQYPVG